MRTVGAVEGRCVGACSLFMPALVRVECTVGVARVPLWRCSTNPFPSRHRYRASANFALLQPCFACPWSWLVLCTLAPSLSLLCMLWSCLVDIIIIILTEASCHHYNTLDLIDIGKLGPEGHAWCVTSTGTLKAAKAWIKRPMHGPRPTGEQDTLDRQKLG